MSKLVLIDCGHTLKGGDTGASGQGYKEENCTRDIGNKLSPLLNSKGYDTLFVHIDSASSENSSLQARVNNANKYPGAILYVSIHMNSSDNSQANGSEVYISAKGGQAEIFATRIESRLVNLGFYNRGVKTANFYVLRKTTMPAVLVECCFISSAKDMGIYDSSKIAQAIAEGIANSNIETTPEIPSKPSTSQSNSNNTNKGLTPGDLCATKNVSRLLNLRATGSLSGKILAEIPYNDTFTYNYVDSNYLGWLNVTYRGINGYVNAEYVQKSNNQSKIINGKVINVSSYLNVRNGASKDSTVIGKVFADEKVKILDYKNGWYYIEYNTANGTKKGYVNSTYIRKI